MIYQKIKKIYITLTYITNLVTFIVTQIYGNKRNGKYKEYTSLSKYFANFYIIILHIIFILNTLFPNFFIANFLSKHCYYLVSDWGKMIISYLISIMFWGTDSKSHFLYGIITLVSCLGLYIIEFILNCKILTEETEEMSIPNEKTQKNFIKNGKGNDQQSKDILINKVQLQK